MRLSAVNILEIKVTNTPKKLILEEIWKYLESQPKFREKIAKNLVIFTPNSEQIVRAQHDQKFKDMLNKADIAIPDSVGVVWAGKMLTKNGPVTRIPGVDLMEELVQGAAERHVPVRLIGGRDKMAVRAFECLRAKYPGLTTTLEAPLVFVALGAPKQEQFILNEAINEHGKVFMAVGGSFDMIAGYLPRAPKLLRVFGLEWAWRLALQPWRIWRQLALIEFFVRVVRAFVQATFR